MTQTSDPLPAGSEAAPKATNPRNLLLFGGLAGGGVLLFLCIVTAAILGFVLLRNDNRQQAQTANTELAVDAVHRDGAAGLPAEAVNRIAFIDAAGRLGTTSPDGSEQRLLTPEGARFQFPAWSPDSASLAAIGIDEESAGVFVVADHEAADPRALYRSTFRAPIYLFWAPTGQQISFIANDRSGLALHLVPADGSRDSRILSTGQPFYWDWTADGDQMLIHSGGLGENARLAFIDTEGQPVGDPLARPGLFQAPGISPSGRYLAFAAAEGETLELVVQSSEGPKRSALPQRGLVAMAWSPVADQLAFSGGVRGMAFFGPLKLVDAVSGDVRALSDELVLAFFWSPDGRSIAYLTPDSAPNDPGAYRNASDLVANDLLADPLGTGQQRPIRLALRVLDVASGESRLLSRFQPTELFLNQFIPFFDQYALSHRIWSPGSDAIVMPMVDGGGRAQVTVVPLNGDRPQAIVEGSVGFWSPD